MSASDAQPPRASGRPTLYAFGVAFVASIGGFLFGFDLAIVGAANLYLKDVFELSPKAFGFATGSAALGCIVGPFFGAWLCDAIGRKKTMIVASLLLAASAIMTALPKDIIVFNIFRIVGGVGIGLCSVASPMYISEVAPPRMRGRLGTMYQLAIVVGSIIAPLAAYGIVRAATAQPDDVQWEMARSFLMAVQRICPESAAWRWMFASEMAAILVFVGFLLPLPPSPRWLAGRGRYDEALAVLTKVDGSEYAESELKQIRESLEAETGHFSELFQPGLRRAFLIGILLAFFNNWTGWSVMGGYIAHLFESTGLDNRATAILKFAITYGFMGVMTLAACWLVDRTGRRPLWLFASALMALVTALTGVVFHFELSGFIVLAVLMLCTVPHGLALGPLPWLMMSEIFPTRIRAKAVSLTTAFLWVTIFTGAQLFPMLTSYSKKIFGSVGGAFWLFTIICVASFVFGLKILPETKGRTLEEIARSWKKD